MRHTLLRTLLPACVCLGAASTAWADGSATAHSSSAAEAGERASALTGITVDDMDRLLGVGDISFSPDGAWVLYSVTASNVEEDLTQADLWRVAWQGGAAQRLTFTESDSEWMPRWSPQGNRIAFLSDRGRDDGLAQIWIMAAFGGQARQVGEFRGGAEDFDWSPDGTRLVVVARDPERDEDEDEPANPAPIVIDRFGFKEDVTGYLTDR
ncbi:MAG: PD40 domain-containing protein, partial [Xanthomonadales bacterium]|nr:PD40 domain-containing protein [Xanthomonadales bacterium]